MAYLMIPSICTTQPSGCLWHFTQLHGCLCCTTKSRYTNQPPGCLWCTIRDGISPDHMVVSGVLLRVGILPNLVVSGVLLGVGVIPNHMVVSSVLLGVGMLPDHPL